MRVSPEKWRGTYLQQKQQGSGPLVDGSGPCFTYIATGPKSKHQLISLVNKSIYKSIPATTPTTYLQLLL
jgi:hypothetical protein